MEPDLKRKEEQRFALLKAFYDDYESNADHFADTAALAASVGLGTDSNQLHRYLQYLVGEGLIASVARGPNGLIYKITHQGVVEVEAFLRDPKRGTEHFTFGVTQNFYGPVGVTQSGQTNTATVNMRERSSAIELLGLIAQLRSLQELVPVEARSVYAAEVDDLEEAAKAPAKPNMLRRMQDGLASVAAIGGSAVAIKKVVDDIADWLRGAS